MDIKQNLVIEYLHETCDRGSYNRFRKYEFVNVDDMKPGAVVDAHKHKLEIVSVDGDELVFVFRGSRYILNREWQVLGTVAYHVENIYVEENERYVFYFEAVDKEEEWDEDSLIDAVLDMVENTSDGEIWKNIPLARKCMHIMKDLSPDRDNGCINPVQRMYICQRIIEDDMIDIRETPRLFQSYCEYWRVNCYLARREDYETIEEDAGFDMDFFKDADAYIYKLAWMLKEKPGDYGMSLWNEMRTLKADSVQLTPEWEKNIYEVELECDEELKGESRGMGFCFGYWSAKRAALARRGIEWRSPSSMNPGVMFD